MKIVKVLFAALLAATVFAPVAEAQLTAASAFADAPKTVFPLLDRNVRLDMVDYFNGGLSTASTNALQGKSRITALTPTDMKIAMTDASSYQLSLLPANNDTIIALIQTVATPAHDSHITFYSRSWAQLGDNLFSAPSLSDWMTPAAKKSGADVSAMIPFMLAEYTYDPDSRTLTLKNNLSEFLSPDVYSLIGAYLLPSMTYRWDGKRMNLSK